MQVLANEAIGNEKQISLTPAKIQELVNGTFTNNGFIIIADTELNDRFNYKASDSSAVVQRPKLVIEYTTSSSSPTPGPSPTPTASQTPTPTRTPTAAPTTPSQPFSNATFVYDGDGKRVKSVFNSNTTTYFVGAHYEVTGSTITKYYYAGAQRIAMRTNGTLSYLLGDHLGSASLTTNASGSVISELRYKAWGEVRFASGNMPTKYTYTGQYSDSYINLLWYGSRHYDPELGRFTSPDTIVPTTTQGVQAYDRYAYANNNPVLYNDPSGHCIGPLAIACIGVALVGLTVAMSQIPSDVQQADPANWGNENVFWAGISVNPVVDAVVATVQCATSGCDPVTYSMTVLPGPNPNTLANAADDLADDPATLARLSQGSGDYPGVDDWENYLLPEGSAVWGGEPGQTNFYTTTQTMSIAGNDATEIFQGLQVGIPEGIPTYREGMTLYLTKHDMLVAKSIALQNRLHGPGGFEQFFIPKAKDVLDPIFTLFLKNR